MDKVLPPQPKPFHATFKSAAVAHVELNLLKELSRTSTSFIGLTAPQLHKFHEKCAHDLANILEAQTSLAAGYEELEEGEEEEEDEAALSEELNASFNAYAALNRININTATELSTEELHASPLHKNRTPEVDKLMAEGYRYFPRDPQYALFVSPSN